MKVPMSWLAYQVIETEQKIFNGQWVECQNNDLPDNDVLIEVLYSSLNYKDALSASGAPGVTKSYPHVPGIDAVGRVISDKTGKFQVNEEVLVFGYDLGMNTSGGFSQRISVPVGWVLSKPQQISNVDAMSWGTAGFTAALSVEKLLSQHITPDKGPIAVTGGTGGVGSVAIKLLSHLGFDVVAITGKEQESTWLKSIGADSIVSRDALLMCQDKAMSKMMYQGAVDTCGGNMISSLLPQISYGGAVTTCGMVAGSKFSASVFPFILRDVSLLGVDSVNISLERKQALLNKVASDWKIDSLDALTTVISKNQLANKLQSILQGKAKGRGVLDLNAE
jgi:acrylyl-CoA reductase (NADPH)